MDGIRSLAIDGDSTTPLRAKYSRRVMIKMCMYVEILHKKHTKIPNERARTVTESQRETPEKPLITILGILIFASQV